MRVLHITPEIYPYLKTGGLGDVAGALPLALNKTGVDNRLCLPGYQAILDHLQKPETLIRFGDYFGARSARLLTGRLDNGIKAYVLDAPDFYMRSGVYVDDNGLDWQDNAFRFAALSKTAADLHLYDPDWRADILHSHDWQGGLVPLYSRLSPHAKPPKTVLTIHNIAYQGLFPADNLARLGLPPECYKPEGIEYYQKIGFLKAGLFYADQITTVSPTYAAEIQSSPLGCGLEGLLAHRKDRLAGILNGIDNQLWDPENDPELPYGYSAQDMTGKGKNRNALIKEFDLTDKAKGPLLTVISRMTPQKGLDMIAEILPWLVKQDAQMIILGAGDQKLEDLYLDLARQYPDRLAVKAGYDEALAHRLLGGADAVLMPSQFEPCGLVQLYGLRYGTLPLVRATGGLADTVENAGVYPTGFKFETPTAEALQRCLEQLFETYADPKKWAKMQQSAMQCDFSWNRSARLYKNLYENLIGPDALNAAPRSLTDQIPAAPIPDAPAVHAAPLLKSRA